MIQSNTLYKTNVRVIGRPVVSYHHLKVFTAWRNKIKFLLNHYENYPRDEETVVIFDTIAKQNGNTYV